MVAVPVTRKSSPGADNLVRCVKGQKNDNIVKTAYRLGSNGDLFYRLFSYFK